MSGPLVIFNIERDFPYFLTTDDPPLGHFFTNRRYFPSTPLMRLNSPEYL